MEAVHGGQIRLYDLQSNLSSMSRDSVHIYSFKTGIYAWVYDVFHDVIMEIED